MQEVTGYLRKLSGYHTSDMFNGTQHFTSISERIAKVRMKRVFRNHLTSRTSSEPSSVYVVVTEATATMFGSLDRI